MTHTYNITGMTCAGCAAKIKQVLESVAGITSAAIDPDAAAATLSMQHHIAIQTLQQALAAYPKYGITEKVQPVAFTLPEEEAKPWLQTYKPILLVFAYIAGITLIAATYQKSFNMMHWLNSFMAAFFLVFSFFKLLNVQSFADSYSSYDIIAKHWRGWGIIYAFVELALGLAFLLHLWPIVTNAVALVVMTVSIIGVLQSVLARRKIRCACLGTVFDLPMSTITIIEDALMIAMSGAMLVLML